MVKIQNSPPSKKTLQPRSNNKITEKQSKNVPDKDLPSMGSEEAIEHLTKLAEFAANNSKSFEQISITVKSSNGTIEKYTLLPTPSDVTDELDYVLVVTQPQSESNEFSVSNKDDTLHGIDGSQENGTRNFKNNLRDGHNKTPHANGCHKTSTDVIGTNGTSDAEVETSEADFYQSAMQMKFDKDLADPELIQKFQSILPKKRGRAGRKPLGPGGETSDPAPETETGHSSSRYACKECDYKTDIKGQLSKHVASHLSERPYKCKYCERNYKTARMLTYHTNTHRALKPYRCNECPHSCATPGELHRHRMYKHTKVKKHKCQECDYACVEYAKLRRHMQAHLGYRPFACPHCPFRSVDNFKLQRHLRIHTGEKPYKCQICHRAFTQQNTLKTHMLVHTDRKPEFKCHLCSATLTRKTDLRVHFSVQHTNEKPLICRKCGKFFPDRYSYRTHHKTHQGEKCFKCELCSFACATAKVLNMHTWIHTEEKPYKCHYCAKGFGQKAQLRRHVNTYHDLSNSGPNLCFKSEFNEEETKVLLARKKPGRKSKPNPFPVTLPDPRLDQPSHALDHAYSTRLPPYIIPSGAEGCGPPTDEPLERALALLNDDPEGLGHHVYDPLNELIIKREDHSESAKPGVDPGPRPTPTNHNPKVVEKYPCVHCIKPFKSITTLKIHYKRTHPGMEITFKKIEESAVPSAQTATAVDLYHNDTTMVENLFIPDEGGAKASIKDMEEDMKAFESSQLLPTGPSNFENETYGSTLPNALPNSTAADWHPSSAWTNLSGDGPIDGHVPPTIDALIDIQRCDSSIFFADFSHTNLLLSPAKDALEATILNAFTDWDSMKISTLPNKFKSPNQQRKRPNKKRRASQSSPRRLDDASN